MDDLKVKAQQRSTQNVMALLWCRVLHSAAFGLQIDAAVTTPHSLDPSGQTSVMKPSLLQVFFQPTERMTEATFIMLELMRALSWQIVFWNCF